MLLLLAGLQASTPNLVSSHSSTPVPRNFESVSSMFSAMFSVQWTPSCPTNRRGSSQQQQGRLLIIRCYPGYPAKYSLPLDSGWTDTHRACQAGGPCRAGAAALSSSTGLPTGPFPSPPHPCTPLRFLHLRDPRPKRRFQAEPWPNPLAWVCAPEDAREPRGDP